MFGLLTMKDILNRILKDGKPNNHCGTKHTINRAIRLLKRNITYKFYLNSIKKLLHIGATVCNNNINNTLTLALSYVKRYINYHTTEAEKCMISFIQTLIDAGAKPSNAQDHTNTLTAVIKTKNLALINKIIELDSLPDNHQHYENVNICVNTLTCAVETNIVDIVKIACNVGALPNLSNIDYYNTLTYAAQLGNTDIIKEIVMVGGKCEYISVDDEQICNNENNINLLLCSGTKFVNVESGYFYWDWGQSNSEVLRMMCYLDIMQQSLMIRADAITQFMKKRYKLRKALKLTMDNLVTEYANKQLKKTNLEDMLSCMPICCVDIIYSYGHISQPFETIDWMDKKFDPYNPVKEELLEEDN